MFIINYYMNNLFLVNPAPFPAEASEIQRWSRRSRLRLTFSIFPEVFVRKGAGSTPKSRPRFIDDSREDPQQFLNFSNWVAKRAKNSALSQGLFSQYPQIA